MSDEPETTNAAPLHTQIKELGIELRRGFHNEEEQERLLGELVDLMEQVAHLASINNVTCQEIAEYLTDDLPGVTQNLIDRAADRLNNEKTATKVATLLITIAFCTPIISISFAVSIWLFRWLTG